MMKRYADSRARVARRLRQIPLLRRFVRDPSGTAAVEFAIVIAPFLALLFAIIETALVFFASQTLETAVADSARLIFTGQAQNNAVNNAAWKADPTGSFKTEVCNRLKAMFDCSKGFYIDVRSYNAFSAADMTMPLVNGKLDPAFTPQYNPGTQGSIVVVRVLYEWPLYLTFLNVNASFNLGTMSNGNRMLMSTAAFRNEPY